MFCKTTQPLPQIIANDSTHPSLAYISQYESIRIQFYLTSGGEDQLIRRVLFDSTMAGQEEHSILHHFLGM